ncbi:WcaF family extracellular polysaccharide biosynthesis acetyltransferase [Maribacter sp. M208]|uniref:WcaF family extracellular polysaccharide biosynthesis acetyltransferase n=1 Tax=Maribacter huludaoensis TaxID=3030010 RepID=UPI0023EA9F43|nr:WcaF family extracellular polysaccharide biosynthesis acetyltransferase [Maribacter huludaoensis]MDF4221141.1 WcaF family extracellular polysaccharide biosynthesis acetyltransferase [Maribacter huludaoensis]
MEYQNLQSFKMPVSFRGRSKYIVQLWWIINATLFSWSPQFLFGWRRFLLRIFGAEIGKNVLIRSSVKITYPWKLKIGDYSWIGDDCVIYNLDKITIGSNVALAHKVYLNTGGHEYDKPTFDIFSKPVVIEDECWLTNDVYIAPGVKIGKGAIIAARSTVLKDVKQGTINAGTPSKIIKERIPK